MCTSSTSPIAPPPAAGCTCSANCRSRSATARSRRWSVRPDAARQRCCASSSGSIAISKAASGLPAHGRLGIVFQEPRLLPWRTVEQNVRLAAPQASDAALDALFATLGLAEHRRHYPGELSLGLARRVALARAFAVEPELLVLDEPFVSLDAALAARLRAELVELVVAQAGHHASRHSRRRRSDRTRRPRVPAFGVTRSRARRGADRTSAHCAHRGRTRRHPGRDQTRRPPRSRHAGCACAARRIMPRCGL